MRLTIKKGQGRAPVAKQILTSKSEIIKSSNRLKLSPLCHFL
ncbi:hypothetical protein KNP414_03373 [Paenibacillus mucilaginosus KNP414]|uniref:Uncharacterized protein n=1 Tax=Paenibacillus mucilaginosus (strain KNP414) TaxID=1036673 RepID=F8F643_PAEMK|nr:hypothetical protein KNP414_03373 [Paenibacillus mucilaginosus KNP414]